MANRGFYCADGYLKRTAKLSDQELGRLFRACMTYHATGELIELTGRESVAFDFIREDIDAANEAYEAKCETNRRNRMGSADNERSRSITTDNDRQRSSTIDNETVPEVTNCHETLKEKEKEKEEEKKKEKKEKEAAATLAREERFSKFWSAYPRHEAKHVAKKAFDKLNPDDALLDVMLRGVEAWKQTDQWQRDGGQYIPHPATWINQRRWEDEPMKGGGAYGVQDYGRTGDIPAGKIISPYSWLDQRDGV